MEIRWVPGYLFLIFVRKRFFHKEVSIENIDAEFLQNYHIIQKLIY